MERDYALQLGDFCIISGLTFFQIFELPEVANPGVACWI